MKTTFKTILLFVLILIKSVTIQAQAKLTVENDSQRSMVVKVMKKTAKKGTLHETVQLQHLEARPSIFLRAAPILLKQKQC